MPAARQSENPLGGLGNFDFARPGQAKLAGKRSATIAAPGRSVMRRRVCAPGDERSAAWPGAFSRPFEPTPKLVVLGADPTALAIAWLGGKAGFETTLVRPKGPETPPPFEVADGGHFLQEDCGEELAEVVASFVTSTP